MTLLCRHPSSALTLPDSQKPGAATLTGSEVVVISQNGVDVRTTLAAIAAYLRS